MGLVGAVPPPVAFITSTLKLVSIVNAAASPVAIIILLVPFILWFGGIRQIERYAELFEGVKLVAISLGFVLGTFVPLFYAYLYSKDKVDLYGDYK